MVQPQLFEQPPHFRRGEQPTQTFVPFAELLQQLEVRFTHSVPLSYHLGLLPPTPRFQFRDRDLVLDAKADRVVRFIWDAPGGRYLEGMEPARPGAFVVVGVPDGKNLGHDGANDSFDFGEFLPLEGCKNRYCGVVGGYV